MGRNSALGAAAMFSRMKSEKQGQEVSKDSDSMFIPQTLSQR